MTFIHGRWIALVILALAAPVRSEDAAMEAKRKAEVGLQPGMTLGKDNAALAEGLIPPELLAYYKNGEWSNRVEDFPQGLYKWDDEFLRWNEENAKNLDLDAQDVIVDKRTGRYPERIYGYPFPKIDAKDPKAGAKIAWNQLYLLFAHLTDANYYVDIVWMNRQGIERAARMAVYFKYFDGKTDYRMPKGADPNLLQQYIAAAESPQDLHGTTALQWRFKGEKRDLMWTYVPALRRIRSVSPANRSDGFLGSDISQDDGPFFDGKPSDFTWKLVGEAEALRLMDPFSLKGDTQRELRPDGSYVEGIRNDVSPFCARDPNCKGLLPWAPSAPVLSRRPVWIIEGVPKDKYYLYGKIELWVDKENFSGVYNRKFSWQGEHMHDYVPTGFLSKGSQGPNGQMEYFWSGAIQYFSGINFKLDRASNVSFPEGTYAVRHNQYPANFFDYQTLYRFGK